jgi:hypothetical protein
MLSVEIWPFVIRLSVVMLTVITLSVIPVSVVRLIVVAPVSQLDLNLIKRFFSSSLTHRNNKLVCLPYASVLGPV